MNADIRYEYCNASDPKFIKLTDELDIELSQRYGAGQAKYDAYNRIVNAHAVIAMDGVMTAACGCFKPYDAETVEIKRMYVKPEYRGRGVARELLKRLEAQAKLQGYQASVLETGRKQPEAIRLYEKSGYERIQNYGQYADIPDSVCFKKLFPEAD